MDILRFVCPRRRMSPAWWALRYGRQMANLDASTGVVACDACCRVVQWVTQMPVVERLIATEIVEDEQAKVEVPSRLEVVAAEGSATVAQPSPEPLPELPEPWSEPERSWARISLQAGQTR